MEKPIRIQLKRTKGWRMPPNTMKIDRSTRWGNPFRVGEIVGLKAAKRWGWRMSNPQKRPVNNDIAMRMFAVAVGLDGASQYEIRQKLRGKNLACWCPLDQPCHADVLLEIANG